MNNKNMDPEIKKYYAKKRMKIIKNVSIVVMIALLYCCSAAFGEQSEPPFHEFFREHGILISVIVCAVWLVSGLSMYKEQYKVGETSLGFAFFYMALFTVSRLFNSEKYLATPDQIIETACTIFLLAASLAALISPKDKK